MGLPTRALKCFESEGEVDHVLFFLTEHHAMEAYWGSGGIVPCIFCLNTRWR
jgi:hypothetical protein